MVFGKYHCIDDCNANSSLDGVQEYQNSQSLLSQQAEAAHLVRQAFCIFRGCAYCPSKLHTNRKHATALPRRNRHRVSRVLL